jgi:hypothetical protein
MLVFWLEDQRSRRTFPAISQWFQTCHKYRKLLSYSGETAQDSHLFPFHMEIASQYQVFNYRSL